MSKLPNKFSSVDELISAYVELEKEFTKRCKENKKTQAELDSLKGELERLKLLQVSSVEEIREEQKEEIIKEFLSSIKSGSSEARLLGGGEAVRTPSRKPKSLQEANLMAKFFLLGD